MVSNSLGMDLQDLLEALKRMRKEHGDSADYRKLRRELPKEWPL